MPSNFSATSRYLSTPVKTWSTPEGADIAYLARRFLPHPEALPLLGSCQVVEGDRPDTVAAAGLGDAELSWRVADANRVMSPRELSAVPGAVLRITLPEGVPGVPHV